MTNVEELKLGLELAEEAHARGALEQSEWLWQGPCGTKGCFAGNYALATMKENGYEPQWLRYCAEEGTQYATWLYPADGGPAVSVDDYTATRMDLTVKQACALFYGGNGIEDLRKTVSKILAGEL